jgi:hypothetical protein
LESVKGRDHLGDLFIDEKIQETPDYPVWLGNIFSRIIETPDYPQKM